MRAFSDVASRRSGGVESTGVCDECGGSVGSGGGFGGVSNGACEVAMLTDGVLLDVDSVGEIETAKLTLNWLRAR